jgi:hypothetical protein
MLTSTFSLIELEFAPRACCMDSAEFLVALRLCRPNSCSCSSHRDELTSI